jgi:hypothetical protein
MLTDQLCRFLPEHSLVCYAPKHATLGHLKATQDLNINVKYGKKPPELILGGRVKFLTYLNEVYSRAFRIPKLVKSIVRYGQEHQVDRVWCILQGQTMIRLAKPVAKQLKVPLFTQIWDDPSWWIRENKIDAINAKSILAEFDSAIKASAACGTASYAMSSLFEDKYHVKTSPLIASLDEAFCNAPDELARNTNKGNSHTYTIGISGQLYAMEEWQALIAALHEANWQLKGKPVKIRYLGYQLNISSHNPVHVEYMGYREQAESISLLSECDLLYCPYFFAPEYEAIASTSFPSKVTAYLAAARPILFHGPEYASPATFLAQHQAASFCHNLDKNELLKKIEHVLTSEQTAKTLVANGNTALANHLTTTQLRRHFSRFLELDSEQRKTQV